MKCAKCGKEISEGDKFCSGCGTPAPIPAGNMRQSGVRVGDVGYMEGGITDASTHGSASVGAINVHLGRPDLLYEKALHTVVECPLCGRQNDVSVTFRCRKCGRKDLCIRHQDEETFYCQACAREIARLVQQGESAFEERRWSQAEDLLEKLLDVEPGHLRAKEMLREAREHSVRLAWLEKAAREAETCGDLTRAAGLVDEMVPLSWNGEAVKVWRIRLETEMEKTALLRKARENAAQLDALEGSARSAETRGDIEAAISLLDQMIPLSPDPEGIRNRRDILERGLEERRQEADERERAEAERKRESEKVRTFAVKDETFKMVRIPAGEFLMGSPPNEPDRDKDETQHRVRISRDFWIGQTEVTQGLWKAVMGNNPSYFKDWGSDCPVEQVSWEDCQEFIRKLNGMVSGGNFRLPTEAEWEYACRAGTTGPYAGDLDAMGWYGNNSGEKGIDAQAVWDQSEDGAEYAKELLANGCRTHAVQMKRSNAWGLYDMHGNVWEWCQDWFGNYPSGSVTDPTGPSSGSNRVLRGGSWSGYAGVCRSADRYGIDPGYRCSFNGFRLALP